MLRTTARSRVSGDPCPELEPAGTIRINVDPAEVAKAERLLEAGHSIEETCCLSRLTYCVVKILAERLKQQKQASEQSASRDDAATSSQTPPGDATPSERLSEIYRATADMPAALVPTAFVEAAKALLPTRHFADIEELAMLATKLAIRLWCDKHDPHLPDDDDDLREMLSWMRARRHVGRELWKQIGVVLKLPAGTREKAVLMIHTAKCFAVKLLPAGYDRAMKELAAALAGHGLVAPAGT